MTREATYDEVFDAQQHFRVLMESLARPGQLNRLSHVALKTPKGIHQASALIGLALMNEDVTFHVPQEDSAMGAYFALHARATQTSVEEADFVFITGNCPPKYIEDVKVGQPSYPENSAFIIIDVALIREEPLPDGVVLQLEGPGVYRQKEMFVSAIEVELLEAIKEKNMEYPLGVDLFLTDENDGIIGIPRTNNFRWKKIRC